MFMRSLHSTSTSLYALEDNLKLITQGKTCYIQSNVMRSLSLMITYIRYRRYSTKSKYFGPFYYIQIDPQDYGRIPSTTPGAEPPRDARDSGSARSHSTHLETSSSDQPKWSPTRRSTRYQDQISVKCTRRTLRMPSFTRAAHAQPSLSNFPRRDSNFGERTRSRGTTLGEQKFPTSPQNKITKLTHCSIYMPMRTISTPQIK